MLGMFTTHVKEFQACLVLLPPVPLFLRIYRISVEGHTLKENLYLKEA